MSNEQFKQVATILIHGNEPLFKRDGSSPTVAELTTAMRQAFAHVSDDTPERDAKILELERERDEARDTVAMLTGQLQESRRLTDEAWAERGRLRGALADCVESLIRLPDADKAYRQTCINQARAALEETK